LIVTNGTGEPTPGTMAALCANVSDPIKFIRKGVQVMVKRVVLMAAGVWLAAMPVHAQAPKAEVSVFAGWVFSDGVVGFFVGPNAEVGFIYSDQPTKLEVSGTATKDVGDQSTHTYHGYFGYNWGASDAPIRPFAMFGLGATSYSDVNFTTVTGANRTISGVSRFSTTIGVGAKVYGKGPVGGRFGLQWTPTYIKSDATGYWCDPYWGCYLVGNAQYANQFTLDGGVTIRF
jgi:hypothetical protein